MPFEVVAGLGSLSRDDGITVSMARARSLALAAVAQIGLDAEDAKGSIRCRPPGVAEPQSPLEMVEHRVPRAVSLHRSANASVRYGSEQASALCPKADFLSPTAESDLRRAMAHHFTSTITPIGSALGWWLRTGRPSAL